MFNNTYLKYLNFTSISILIMLYQTCVPSFYAFCVTTLIIFSILPGAITVCKSHLICLLFQTLPTIYHSSEKTNPFTM